MASSHQFELNPDIGNQLVIYFGQENLQKTYLSQRNPRYQDRQQILNTVLGI